MTVFVLIHGMWHGGWCWQKVTPLLRAAGHEAYTPTLAGLGERAHLQSADIDLNTHIQDVVGVFESADLREAILVGHSLGGFMVPAVAARIPDRIAHLVDLDGPLPEDGKALKDLFGATWDFFKRTAIEGGDEWWLAPIADWTFGVSGADLEWMRSKLTPHPLKTLATPVNLANPAARAIPRTFVACTEKPLEAEELAVEEMRYADLGWRYRYLPTGHDAMITTPQGLVSILFELV